MKTSVAVIGIFLAGCLLATGCVHHHHSQPAVVEPEYEPAAPIGGPVGADPVVDMFYNDLAPYGEWVYIDGPGWVWSPYDVAADWRPYQYGHWAYTDYGWTWASDEEYGWAVYHYGRWHQAPRYGWVWVPGSEWGPAWVAWQESDAWVGWAPLPYHVGWRVGVGLDWGNSNVRVSIQSGHWSFVATRYLVAPQVHRHIAPRARNTNYINVTNHVTNYTYIDNRVINNSVRVKNVGRAVGHPVRKHHVRRADKPGRTRGGRDNDDDLVIYRPREHPGREPQRRPVPPGHDDEHQGKKDRRGQNNGQKQQDGKGRNAPEERPAAHRPARGEKPEASRTNNGRKSRPAEMDERSPNSTPPRDNNMNRSSKKNHPQAAPSDRSNGRDQKNQLQPAPRPTREPRDDARPAASDYRSSGSKKTRPTASQPAGSKGNAASDKNSQAGGSKSGASKSNKSKSGDAKDSSSGSNKSGKGDAKGGKSGSNDAKSGKSKPVDPEEEEEDSGEKKSKKRD